MKNALGRQKGIEKLRTIGRAVTFIRALRNEVNLGTRRGKSPDELSLLEKRLRTIKNAERAALVPLAEARDPLWQLGMRERPRARPWPQIKPDAKNMATSAAE